MKKIFLPILLAASFTLAPNVFAQTHAIGTNVKLPDGTIAMITRDGQRRPYTSAGAFLSYGLNSFVNVQIANAEDIALPLGAFIPPQDGKIICSDRGADKGTCYLISLGQKSGFTSGTVFSQLGFTFSRATTGDVSFMQTGANISSGTSAHLPGVLINNKGTIVLVGQDTLLGIPTIQTFQSWGYTFADVVDANSADLAKAQGAIMPEHAIGALSPNDLLGVDHAEATNTPGIPPVYVSSQTPIGAIVISTDTTTPIAQTVAMSSKKVPLAVFHIQETSGNEGVIVKGLSISALAGGGTTVGNSAPNTSFDTFKNFTLSDGTTSVTRTGWKSGTTPLAGTKDAQTYTIDFLSGSPLNFIAASSSTLTLTLTADVNDWYSDASAGSTWNFRIGNQADAQIVGQNSQQVITPIVSASNVSNTQTIAQQPLSLKAVTSISQPAVSAPATGQHTLQDIMGIFSILSPSSPSHLTSITISQSGSAIPSGTTTPVNYYVYDAAADLAHPIAIISLPPGTNSATAALNLNSASFKGVGAPTSGSGTIVITADTTSFNTSAGYALSITGWQWAYDAFPNTVITGPADSSATASAVYGSGKDPRTY